MFVTNIRNRTWAEINLDNAVFNFQCVKNFVKQNGSKTKICCVIKANAYGHSAVELAYLYQQLNADYLAVSNIEEALQLRTNGITLPILVLGYTSINCADILADNNITQTVYSLEYGLKLSENALSLNKKVNVHVKLDTGMGRIGFVCRDNQNNQESESYEDILNIFRAKGLFVEGIFTHFAVADEGEEGKDYSRTQYSHFLDAIAYLEAKGIVVNIKHCANSAAIFDYPKYYMDMVRVGMVLYGLRPSNKVANLPVLKPVMILHSIVSHIKKVYAGQSISYGRDFVADKELLVATIPIGYADGFSRNTGAKGYELCVNGQAAPVLGRVSMDQLMVDVSNIPCKIGDDVIVFGTDEPFTVENIAKLNNTINYEVVCNIGERVPRAFVKNGNIIKWNDKIYE